MGWCGHSSVVGTVGWGGGGGCGGLLGVLVLKVTSAPARHSGAGHFFDDFLSEAIWNRFFCSLEMGQELVSSEH